MTFFEKSHGKSYRFAELKAESEMQGRFAELNRSG